LQSFFPPYIQGRLLLDTYRSDINNGRLSQCSLAVAIGKTPKLAMMMPENTTKANVNLEVSLSVMPGPILHSL
jgi:hypothetical protein